MSFVELDQLVPFDGRTLNFANAEKSMLLCIAHLEDPRIVFNSIDEWLMVELMRAGQGYSTNVQEAIDTFTGTRVGALFLRAMQIYWGYGVLKNNTRALTLCREGIELGDVSGRCHVIAGRALEMGDDITPRNIPEAFQMYREGARRGSAFSLCEYGDCFYSGVGVKLDFSAALDIYKRARTLGYPTACFNLGWMYHRGEGAPMSVPLAVEYHKEAARRGTKAHHNSEEQLALIFENDRSALIPFARWRPQSHIHKWVSASMKRQIMCLLMARRRPRGFIALLPRGVLLQICFYLVCRPQTIQVSFDAMQRGHLERNVWRMEQRLSLVEHSLQHMQYQLAEILHAVMQRGEAEELSREKKRK